jgi:transposase InsO family protein
MHGNIEKRVLIAVGIKSLFSRYAKYRSPRVREELKDRGYCVSSKRVARLMREAHLGCVQKKKYRITTNSNHHEPVAGNILNRQYFAPAPGKVWVSDITYCAIKEGWMYLYVIIDLWNRQVVGGAVRNEMTAQIVIDTFQMAILQYGCAVGLVFHSDRGVQYCCSAFKSALANSSKAIVQSMSRKGNCWDNACAESFFKTVNRGLECLEGRSSRAVVRSELFEYIEIHYNRLRRHSANGMMVPIKLHTRVA